MFESLADADSAASRAAVLVDAIVEEERVAARAMARQAKLIAELHQCQVMIPPAQDPGRTTLDRAALVEAELATALHVSPHTAATRIQIALALTQRLPRTLAALREGGLDLYRAQIIVQETAEVAAHATSQTGTSAAVEISRVIEERILPRACRQNPRGLHRSLARAVIAADPDAAARRHESAARDRRASFVPLPDAMCELVFRLPAPEGAAVWNILDQHARAARAGGDPRTLDQLRVDTLVDIVTSATGTGAARGTGAHVLVTVGADTLLDLDDEPGDLDGYGPMPAHLAPRIAAGQHATWSRILTDPATGALLDYGRTTYTPPAALADHVTTRDKTCTFPGCHIHASRCDLDHVIPFPKGPTSAQNLRALCRHHHLLKHRGGWQIVIDPETGETTWISPSGRRHPWRE